MSTTRPLAAALALALAVLVAGAGCQREPDWSVRLEPLDVPVPEHSAEPRLTSARGHLYLSWLTAEDDTVHALQYARLEAGGWSPPQTVVTAADFFVNWADFPSLTELSDGSLLAHWLRKHPSGDAYAYGVELAWSRDGRSWSPPLRAHTDGSATEHGFVTLVPLENGEAQVVWLDGRDYAAKAHDEAQMSLRTARFVRAGIAEEQLLDPRTCDCCPTHAVRTARGLLVAYRDRSAEEVRDISLVRLQADGTWTDPYPLAEDGWKIAGCPVNGPALDARGDRVVAAWFTAANDVNAVKVAFSDDGGATFGPPVRVDDGHPSGRTDVVLLPEGGAMVVWLESPPDEVGDPAIHARHVRADGSVASSFQITATSAARASGFPQLAQHGDALYFAWTEVGPPSRVRAARLPLP